MWKEKFVRHFSFLKFIYFFSIAFLIAFSKIALGGDAEAGKIRYAQNCGNCHGPAGMGLASYPKISGKEIPYIIERLKTYRSGKKIGSNSALMIMMAKTLTDEEIANLAEYLKDAKYEN